MLSEEDHQTNVKDNDAVSAVDLAEDEILLVLPYNNGTSIIPVTKRIKISNPQALDIGLHEIRGLKNEVLEAMFNPLLEHSTQVIRAAWASLSTYNQLVEDWGREQADEMWAEIQTSVEAAKDNPILKGFGLDILIDKDDDIEENLDPNDYSKKFGWGHQPK